MSASRCRFCHHPLTHRFADLGMSPLANSYVRPEALKDKEAYYPLHAFVCDRCFLVQLEAFEPPETIFGDYAYFSSYSDSWLDHARQYVEMMIPRFGYGAQSQIVEIASNDGYLLQYFSKRGIPALGIEPAANVARAAERKGIRTDVAFFGVQTARRLAAEGIRPDLIVANNVLAHVPDLHDFVQGLKLLLKPDGVITIEVPHLMKLMQGNQFDTIYHEHFSYFSLLVLIRIFEFHELAVFDVEQLPTHGGSLRIFAKHRRDTGKPATRHVADLVKKEVRFGLLQLERYADFHRKVKETRLDVLRFFIKARRSGKRIAAYGAPAKGNTLLNYCGIGADDIEYTVDRNPHKQGLYLPGSRIPIKPPEAIMETKPDYVLILPWNLKEEIMEQMGGIRDWGGKFVTAIPRIAVTEAADGPGRR
ncbi:class I SAM-dependent methyltransferase [Paenibacillus ginsengihumi]|uniref:class I SAM-dependent methyltransferase n=1 Tax=Paenibacillus ginsengihumi TaxID=431596 RepID=UPI000399DE3B|nr:class I SAM-dependent methyltransferase [Paenibacillus ginsengihumi]